jgi:hypothetical protein
MPADALTAAVYFPPLIEAAKAAGLVDAIMARAAEAEVQALDEHHSDSSRTERIELYEPALEGAQESLWRAGVARSFPVHRLEACGLLDDRRIMPATRIIVRRRGGCERRPGARRVTSRSAGGGSSGDPPEPEPPGERRAGRRQHHRFHLGIVRRQSLRRSTWRFHVAR